MMKVMLFRRSRRSLRISIDKKKRSTGKVGKRSEKKKEQPKKRKKKKEKNRDCPLSIDGWVDYLHGISEVSYSIKLALVAIAFSVIAILISISVAFFSNETFIYTMITSILFVIFTWYLAMDMTKHSIIAEEILEEIIKGNLSSSNAIRKQWLSKKKK